MCSHCSLEVNTDSSRSTGSNIVPRKSSCLGALFCCLESVLLPQRWFIFPSRATCTRKVRCRAECRRLVEGCSSRQCPLDSWPLCSLLIKCTILESPFHLLLCYLVSVLLFSSLTSAAHSSEFLSLTLKEETLPCAIHLPCMP